MADYILSADGYVVVHKTDQTSIAASSILSSLISSGYTVRYGHAGTFTNSDYSAGFKGNLGGATIKALYTAPPLTGSQRLEWIQVITTNDAKGTAVSPYLDNANMPENPTASLAPFYSFTQANRNPALPTTQLNFYDYSKRSETDLSATTSKHTAGDPITWSANLFPVIVDGTTLTIENGIGWGWTMKKAMVGTDTGTFLSPASSSGVVTGVGTNLFKWGTTNPDVSSLSFAGKRFDAQPNQQFKLGTLTYHNGSIVDGTEATSVEFDASVSFDNVPEKNFVLKTTFQLINTLNTSDPIASADQVNIGNFGYSFNVLA